MVAENSVLSLVDVSQWLDSQPRTTRDLDLVVGIDLMASEGAHVLIHDSLITNGFSPVPQNAKWQWEKIIDADRNVIVDMHVPVSADENKDVRIQSRRVKYRKSLEKGIHGREDPEAVGGNQSNFKFEWQGEAIKVPNPLTWSVMKLVAMADRMDASRNPENDSESRQFDRAQAQKHAHDVCRVVAMTTREEMDQLGFVTGIVREGKSFGRACDACRDQVLADDGFGVAVVREAWRPEDFELIRRQLAKWFN